MILMQPDSNIFGRDLDKTFISGENNMLAQQRSAIMASISSECW